MTRLKTPPDFDNWSNQYLFFVKEGLGSPDFDDDAAQYTFGFSISPQAKKLGEEYKLLSEAIEKGDGRFLESYFAVPGLKEIRIEDDGHPASCDDLRMDLERFYSGENWGVVYDVDVDTWHDDATGYLNDKDYNLFFFLPEYPWILTDALNWFNALSFENTTHRIKLHQMWNRLRKIQQLGFIFDRSVHEEYDKLFIPDSAVTTADLSAHKIGKLIALINAFQRDYQIKKPDYFPQPEEPGPEEKMLIYAYDYKNAFERYLGKILNSYIHHFRIIGVLRACEYCGSVFRFSRGKRFCSERDGRSCGQTVRNKRFYRRNREKLVLQARHQTQSLRQFYRDRGIKK